jgi:DGQHR domain-containing protein
MMKDLPALRVKQWMPGWSSVDFSKKEHRAEPQHWFYVFSISAGHLKALSGIYPRTTGSRTRGALDLGIQRRHEKERSDEIARFVQFGFPWSGLSKKKRLSTEFDDLRKPGWLPTAIVLNILTAKDARLGRSVDPNDLVEISDKNDGSARISLPVDFNGSQWRPKALPPIEIIDGQHRLWAFEEGQLLEDFELPVVAFKGLDISWQAYLFYTINIKPKRINASLAFDLYPLLRTEDWLSKFEDHIIYRETRAQELVDLLWSHPKSPWHKRINMLGESGQKGRMVSQSAWIHSLLATFMKVWEGRKKNLGGLFGAAIGDQRVTPTWNRAEQAALLIFAGTIFREAIRNTDSNWAKVLRGNPTPKGTAPTLDLALFGPDTLLNQDQGIRAFLYVMNDLLYMSADDLDLVNWGESGVENADEKTIDDAIKSLTKQSKIKEFLETISEALANYDWRSSDANGLSSDQSLLKAAFRGSSGYRQLRVHVLKYLSKAGGRVGKDADAVLAVLGESA